MHQNYKTGYYEMINIHSFDEQGFRWACHNGQYDTVKYLVELYKNNKFTNVKDYKMINIHALDEEGFREACYEGYYYIVKYLMTLYKKHKSIYYPINNYHIIFNKFDKYRL